MFDWRIYRAALLPAVAAFMLMMFSLQVAPSALQRPVATPEFDASQAARSTRSIVELAPRREAGSAGDRAVAELVRKGFSGVAGGDVATQDFSSDYEGADVSLQNVILTIPGASDRILLVVADRDSAAGPGAATSAAATAELLALADDLGAQRNRRTIILASTDGGADGDSGAHELIDALPRPEDVDVAVVLSQPGVDDPHPPFAIGSGTDPESPSAQLMQTARSIASAAFGQRDSAPGPWAGLARLALPVGLGEQAALRGAGIEAVALSASGERQLPAASDTTVSRQTIGMAGSAALELIRTLDDDTAAPASDPGTYVRLGDNLIPGWTIALLALTLLLPPLVTAAACWTGEQRADWRVRRTMPWALERALLPLASLLLLYLLGVVGLIPNPPFPYDPGRFPAGLEAPVAYVALVAAFALAALLIRPTRTPLDSEAHVLAAAGGLMCGGALVGIWLLNPYLALLLFPAAHVWLLPARAAGPPRAWIVAATALVSLGAAIAALATLAGQLDLGLAAPWHLLLLVADGQIGLGTSLLWCVLLGGLIACVSATWSRPRQLPARNGALRGAGTHVGPGALGSEPAAEARLR